MLLQALLLLAGVITPRIIEEATGIEAVVHRYHDNVAGTTQRFAVVGNLLDRRTIGESAAVQPDHHGAAHPAAKRRCPDIEVETVIGRQTEAAEPKKLCQNLGSSTRHWLFFPRIFEVWWPTEQAFRSSCRPKCVDFPQKSCLLMPKLLASGPVFPGFLRFWQSL